MPSIVQPKPEKPSHYNYLKSFRTEQCKDFLQHRCNKHRPYTCFNWHFPNQRRRRPIRKRDGSFNYSADVYCTQYDDSTGSCPVGDSCPYLHRNVGDTERHYHLRYYKTEQCMFTSNSSGHCSKNGPHCMFAHGADDCREPVFDIAEAETGSLNGAAEAVHNDKKGGDQFGEKDEKMFSVDPKWSDPQYVTAHYKTERCPKWMPTPTARFCRQGLMCPFYHSSKDRRRSLTTIKYRAIACPMVKSKDDWGDPEDCDKGDSCQYCHTRMELQYHPDVYKSVKCEHEQCVKGVFCAFSHADAEKMNSEERVSEERLTKFTDGSMLAAKRLANNNAPAHMWPSSDSGHGMSEITFPGGRISNTSGLQDVSVGFKLPQRAESPGASDTSRVSKMSNVGLELPKLAPGCELTGGSGGFAKQSKGSNGFPLAPGAELNNGKGLVNEYSESILTGTMYHLQPSSQGMWTQHELIQPKSGDAISASYLTPSLMLPQVRGQMLANPVERMKRQQILMEQAAHTRVPPSGAMPTRPDEHTNLYSFDGTEPALSQRTAGRERNDSQCSKLLTVFSNSVSRM